MSLALPSCLGLPLFALLALAPAARADGRAWIVDSTGAGDFTDIQSAVNASSADDVVFVRPHHVRGETYDGFVVAGRGANVVGVIAPDWGVDFVHVRDVPDGETVLVRGLAVNDVYGVSVPRSYRWPRPWGAPRTVMSVVNCAGSVRIESCSAFAGGPSTTPTPVVDIASSNDVVLIDTLVAGGSERVSAAIHASVSNVFLEDCSVIGTSGWADPDPILCFYATDGADAIRATAGTSLRLIGCLVQGGDGEQAVCASYHSIGGHAVRADATSFTFLRATAATAGADPSSPAAIVGPRHVSSEPLRDVVVLEDVARGVGLGFELQGDALDVPILLVGPGGARRGLGLEEGSVLVSRPWTVARFPGGAPGARVVDTLLRPTVAPDRVRVEYVQPVYRAPGRARMRAPRSALQIGRDVPILVGGERGYVDGSAPALGGGASWASPMLDARMALRSNVARPGLHREVWVTAGRHVFEEQVRVPRGVTLRGGFRGDETSADERPALGFATTIDGDVLGDDGPGFVNRSDNSIGALVSVSQVVGQFPLGLTLDRLTFRGFENRSTSQYSGVDMIVRAYAPLEIERCRFTDSSTIRAVMHAFHGDLVVRRCEFVGLRGEALWHSQSGRGTVVSSLFAGNETPNAFASINLGSGGTRFVNNTVANNVTAQSGRPAVYVSIGLEAEFSNNVFWNNAANGVSGEREQLYLLGPTTNVRLSHNTIEGWTGTLGSGGIVVGNNGVDPSFEDPLGPDGVAGTADDDHRLGAGSPCIDAGNNFRLPAWALLDLDETARRKDDHGLPDTGVGTAPVVDRGAYER